MRCEDKHLYVQFFDRTEQDDVDSLVVHQLLLSAELRAET